jgi:hypothetical protein
VIQVIVVAECGSELSQIWTYSDGIPNPDLKVSVELSAMCSTEEAVTEAGVSFAGAVSGLASAVARVRTGLVDHYYDRRAGVGDTIVRAVMFGAGKG